MLAGGLIQQKMRINPPDHRKNQMAMAMETCKELDYSIDVAAVSNFCKLKFLMR